MVQPGAAVLDTPRTNLGDATFVSEHRLNFDISQELSFQSPSKDNNIVQQLRNGRRGGNLNLKTPRGRSALADRKNLPLGLAGGEFTPLLKSATRNSSLLHGKENVPRTPALFQASRLGKITESDSPLPQGSSVDGDDTRNISYAAGSSVPHIDSSSTASTPLALPPRRTEGPGILQDGNQLSLREQENVVNRIEKENFALKLKISFLEDSITAMRKATPGFNEKALKENAELKVDKVTMLRDLRQYKKTLTAAEHDVELYRQQIIEMQEKLKQKRANASQREEVDQIIATLAEKDAEVQELRSQLSKLEDSEDRIQDLEADLREKDRLLDDGEDEIANLKDEVEKHNSTIVDLKQTVKDQQIRMVELEEQAQADAELAEANSTIEQLEVHLERLTNELHDSKEDLIEANRERQRAQDDLEELQEEMANKSITPRGLSRQVEEKADRLHEEVEELRGKYQELSSAHDAKSRELEHARQELHDKSAATDGTQRTLQERLTELQSEKEGIASDYRKLVSRLETLQSDFRAKCDERDLLQTRHDALTSESSELHKELTRVRSTINDLEASLEQQKQQTLNQEHDIREEYKTEIETLRDNIEDLEADLREKDRAHDAENDNWDRVKQTLESDRKAAEEKASGLQRTIAALQASEGKLSTREARLQEALDSEKHRHRDLESSYEQQIRDLKNDVETRQQSYDALRKECADLSEQLRLREREQRQLEEKIEALEDEVDVLQTGLEENDQASQDGIAEFRVELARLTDENKKYQQEVAEIRMSRASIEAELEAKQVMTQAGNDSKARFNELLHEAQQRLQELQREKQVLQSRLDAAEAEKHANEIQTRSSNNSPGFAQEVSMLRRDLATSRRKELEWSEREAAQKDLVRGLRRQVTELERKAHEAEISHFVNASSGTSANDSVQRKEISEVRAQLAEVHQSLAQARSQCKELERAAKRERSAAAQDLEARTNMWETDKDALQQSIDDLQLKVDELTAKNTASEAIATRLRSKIERLEKAIREERANVGEDRTMALERQDLHEMLRESQVQAEALELDLRERDKTLARYSTLEASARAKIEQLRQERGVHQDAVTAARAQIIDLEQQMSDMQEDFENERVNLTRGVRFPNNSVSENGDAELQVLKKAMADREQRHLKEMRGVALQVQWLLARTQREERLRDDAANVKYYMDLQIAMYDACNKADLARFRQAGVVFPPDPPPRKKNIKDVGRAIIAIHRMQKLATEWREKRKMQDRLRVALDKARADQRRNLQAAVIAQGSQSSAIKHDEKGPRRRGEHGGHRRRSGGPTAPSATARAVVSKRTSSGRASMRKSIVM